MKVILMKDVAKLGRRLEVKEVPAGHALNFLIPRKFAVSATPENLKRLQAEVEKHSEHKEATKSAFMDACDKLKERTVVYKADANAQGHLFKGINADDIVGQLAAEGITISKDYIELPHPIKEVGIHEIALSHDGVTGVCRLEVIKK